MTVNGGDAAEIGPNRDITFLDGRWTGDFPDNFESSLDGVVVVSFSILCGGGGGC